MSPRPPTSAGIPHAVEEDVTGVGIVPFRSDGEAQIYRDVRDLRKSHRGLVAKVDGLAMGQARTEGMVSTLLQLQRTKSPSQEARAATKEVLADRVLAGEQLTKRFWHSIGVKVAGVIMAAIAGGLMHRWLA